MLLNMDVGRRLYAEVKDICEDAVQGFYPNCNLRHLIVSNQASALECKKACVKGNELLFQVDFEVRGVVHDPNYDEFKQKWHECNEQDDTNRRLRWKIHELEKELKSLLPIFNTRRRREIVSEIDELTSQIDTRLEMVKDASGHVKAIHDKIDNITFSGKEDYYEWRSLHHVIHFSVKTLSFLGKEDNVEINDTQVYSSSVVLDLVPLSRIRDEDKWNETLKHKGSKVKLFKASVVGGTLEDALIALT